MLAKKLTLKKTHDYCATKSPKLTVVFIHGIASDSITFASALEYLEGTVSLHDVRFITFDLLGSGLSPKSDSYNYDYNDQVEALHNSIEKQKITTPLILVGHSLGTLIVSKYANTYKKTIKKLVLVSPPIYTTKDMTNPAFAAGIEVFIKTVSIKNRHITQDKAFINSMDKIILNKNNYKTMVNLKTPATIIYGEGDQIIAHHNILRLTTDNHKYMTAIRTIGHHGVTRDKYNKIRDILEEVLHA